MGIRRSGKSTLLYQLIDPTFTLYFTPKSRGVGVGVGFKGVGDGVTEEGVEGVTSKVEE